MSIKKRLCRIPHIFFKSSVAGFSMSFPFRVNLEPWQGQSHVCSALFHFNAHPRCGHRFFDGVKSPTVDSKTLIGSCNVKILLDGEKSSSYSFVLLFMQISEIYLKRAKHYSLFMTIAGLIVAALCICQNKTPTETIATTSKASTNIHHESGVR